MTKSRGILPPRKRWTDEERAVLRRDYPHMKTERIAQALGRRLHTVYQQAAKLGLTKTVEYLASSDACRLRRDSSVGAPYRFKKGQTPHNKGVRRPGWHTGRMRETWFKKGQMPHNWRWPIGSTRVVDGYLYEKISEASPWTKAWKLSHHLLWKRAGRRPPRRNQALVFRDGDRMNIQLENLELISRRELSRRNHWSRLPKELQQVITLRAAIKRKITMRERYGQHDRRPAKAPVRHARRAQGQRQAARHRASKGRVRGRREDHREREGRGVVSERGGRSRLRVHRASSDTAAAR